MSRARVDLLIQRADMLYGEEDWDWFASLRTALRGITAAQAAWQPGRGANTIWQITNHLAFWKEAGARRIRGEVFTVTGRENHATFGPPGDPGDEEAWRRALERLDAAHRALRAGLEGMSDADLDRSVPGQPGRPMVKMLAGLIEHDAYHGGQIVVMRKLRGWWG